MKLFGWMRHRLLPNNIEPFKDYPIGNYCTCLLAQPSHNDQDRHPKSTLGNGSRYSILSQHEIENSIEFEAEGGDETSTVISGIFHGFLTIGTLGSKRFISEPVTPTFTMSLDDITEEKAEVTENDLELINNELGRFLEAEAEEHMSNESSGRNSLVSTITLSGKSKQETSGEEYGKTIVCPLQGYLFGSSVELQETRFEEKKEKVSLAELFYSTKTVEENPIENCGKEEMQTKKTNKPVKHLIKKILKKFHASSGSSTSPKETSSFSAKKKLQKRGLQVIKLFHRKIHPESSIAEGGSKMNNAPYNVDQIQQAKDNTRFPQGSRSMAGLRNGNTISKLPQYGVAGCIAASENGEHWIKTDADCKYRKVDQLLL
ncbi:hypothetical protein V6N11_034748 [Hibiscus sabdariffa]|uniref:LAZY1 n=1 Tax=Hibiscus sabdariffa TaxID=183260 RepID=A0ABR2NS84_9ROSI